MLPKQSDPNEKGVVEVSSDDSTNDSDEPNQTRDFPWTWKLTALVCGIMLSWGSSFSENTLGPLKKTLISELGITNAQVSIRPRCRHGIAGVWR